MKKKNIKYICIVILLLILTGCSTEYNLEFKDGKFKDNIKIGAFDSKKIGNFDTLEPIASYNEYDIQYYDFKYKKNILNLNHEYTIDDYKKSAALVDCFELSEIIDDDEYYYILATGEFKCLSYLNYKNDFVKVNFTTDLEVESSNADEVKNNVYTWIFNEDNYNNKEINIKINKNKKNNQKNNITILIIVSLLLILFLILYTILKQHNSQKNNIQY